MNRRWWIAVARCVVTLWAVAVCQHALAASVEPVQITLGPEVVALTGPWKFRLGDNPRWATPEFDDSVWETVDLTPELGSHDSDVGLMGYVTGWEARGHKGYSGYAWYRMRVSASDPAGQALALVGPTNVDSAYQIYVDGRLLGGIGDFSHSPPRAYGTNRPTTFPLTSTSAPMLVAVRVWMGAWDLNGTDAGGIHIAPALGTQAGAAALYQIQWTEVIRGYFLEIVLAIGFILLAAMVSSLTPLIGFRPAHAWLAVALVSVALMRANQAVFYWSSLETVQGFELITNVLLVPLMIGAWTVGWSQWLGLEARRWLVPVALVLTALHMLLQVLSASWLHGATPPAIESIFGACKSAVRLLFVVLTLYILARALLQSGNQKWLAVPAITLISIGLFAQELSTAGVRGIWFPYGVGVSRTQYAYAAFDVVFFALVVQRLMQLSISRGPPAR